MNKKFKYRKEFKAVLNRLGISDKTLLSEERVKNTDVVYRQLINAQKRVLKTLLSLPPEAQRLQLENFKKMADENERKRREDNDFLEGS